MHFAISATLHTIDIIYIICYTTLNRHTLLDSTLYKSILIYIKVE